MIYLLKKNHLVSMYSSLKLLNFGTNFKKRSLHPSQSVAFVYFGFSFILLFLMSFFALVFFRLKPDSTYLCFLEIAQPERNEGKSLLPRTSLFSFLFPSFLSFSVSQNQSRNVSVPEAYSELCETSKRECFAKKG